APPAPGPRGAARRRQRLGDVVGAGLGHLGELLAGGRVLHRAGLGGADPAPADEHGPLGAEEGGWAGGGGGRRAHGGWAEYRVGHGTPFCSGGPVLGSSSALTTLRSPMAWKAASQSGRGKTVAGGAGSTAPLASRARAPSQLDQDDDSEKLTSRARCMARSQGTAR